MSASRMLAACAAAALLAGCASVESRLEAHLHSPSEAVRDCAQWYRALDAQTDAAGVRDAQHARIDGFGYLRIDRLLASLSDRAARTEAALNEYAEQLLALEFESRRHEIENLPAGALEALPGLGAERPRRAAFARTQACARLMRKLDLAKPDLRSALLENARVPDDYSDSARLLSLYPLTRLLFSRGVRRWEEQARAAFAAPGGESRPGVVRYAPPAPFPALERSAAAAFIGRAELDPLGIPVLSERELARLAAAYAPSIEVAITGDFDRFGALQWRRGGAHPEVNAAEPVVYVQQAHARYADRILLQLVYTLWFSERPADQPGDILAGALDGLVWRVTLAPDGEPLLYDSIHPCGCYHQFFPTPRARLRPAPDALEEWAFVPRMLPRIGEGERPVLRLASRTHYIEGIELVRDADSVVRYAFRDYDELRSLPRFPGDGPAPRRSAFGPDGIVAGSERPERFLFWPMGIRSAGAMRQWGRQATAFIGRRHFDDAGLLEQRFDLDLGPAQP